MVTAHLFTFVTIIAFLSFALLPLLHQVKEERNMIRCSRLLIVSAEVDASPFLDFARDVCGKYIVQCSVPNPACFRMTCVVFVLPSFHSCSFLSLVQEERMALTQARAPSGSRTLIKLSVEEMQQRDIRVVESELVELAPFSYPSCGSLHPSLCFCLDLCPDPCACSCASSSSSCLLPSCRCSHLLDALSPGPAACMWEHPDLPAGTTVTAKMMSHYRQGIK
jgi:hypothetical protein